MLFSSYKDSKPQGAYVNEYEGHHDKIIINNHAMDDLYECNFDI